MSVASRCLLADGATLTARSLRLGVGAFLVAASLGCGANDESALEPPGPTVPATTGVKGYGDVKVTTVTTGADLDPDGYVVIVNSPWDDDHVPTKVPTNGSVTLHTLTPRTHVLLLLEVAPNCVGEQLDNHPVVVTANSVASVAFELVCSEVPHGSTSR